MIFYPLHEFKSIVYKLFMDGMSPPHGIIRAYRHDTATAAYSSGACVNHGDRP